MHYSRNMPYFVYRKFIAYSSGIACRARSKLCWTITDRSCVLALPIPLISASRNRPFTLVSGAKAAAASAALMRVCSTWSWVRNSGWTKSISTTAKGSETGGRSVFCSFSKSDFSASKIALCTFLLLFSESVLTVNARPRDKLEHRSVTRQNVGMDPLHDLVKAQTFIGLTIWVYRP